MKGDFYMSGILYLVATPIGNLDDITLRAINTLKEVDFIAAEDTRHSLKLLNHLNISKPLISYHRHNENIKSDLLIDKLLDNKNIALITDAGTPIISDPGEEIVKIALEKNIKVVPIPGACALITALISSGLNASSFSFLGFLPLNKKNRKQKLEEIQNSKNTVILYEAPHKLISTLQDLNKILENRKIVLAKELTKIHESFISGTANKLLQKIENPKGEFVMVIEGNNNSENDYLDFINSLSLEEHYQFYSSQGFSKNDIIKKIAKDKNVSKNEIYQHFINKDN